MYSLENQVIKILNLNLIRNLCSLSEPAENTIPTVGFNVITLRHKGHPVIVYDLGGGPQIRAIWTSYFVDVSMCHNTNNNNLNQFKKSTNNNERFKLIILRDQTLSFIVQGILRRV